MEETKFSNRSSWVDKQKSLLELERNAEVESSKLQVEDTSFKHLQDKGVALGSLLIVEKSTGLYGHPNIIMSPKCAPGTQPLLPSHSFSSGDVVGLWEGKTFGNMAQICSGVISKVASSAIHIVLDDEVPELESLQDDALFRLHKLANDVTYKRIKRGLDFLGSISSGPSMHLIGVLFSETDLYAPLPVLPPNLRNKNTDDIVLFNSNLDVSQQEAVKFSILQKDLSVIHGPPGTGKTTTLIEIILQHVKMNCKVLAVAPSNIAVDNLLERLSAAGTKVVRIGHPARASKTAQSRTLDALIHSSDDYSIIKDIHKDIQENLNSLRKVKDKGRRRHIREDIKTFRKELRQREMRISLDILKSCSVVLSTLTSAGDEGPLKHLNEGYFDLTVIDECSQGLEASCYMSILKTTKLLIAGDHQQLPPTVISPEASSQGFLISLMERVIGLYGVRVTRMLKVQYRMNSIIMDWASSAMYDKQLEAHSSVASHLLCHLEGIEKNEDTENALVMIDTAGCDLGEMSGEDLSKGNQGEAAIVATHVKSLLASGVKEKDVAVITPYNLQVELIRGHLHASHPGVEVRSVDGFQGREKEAIVISLVRSNKQGEIGFLAEDRRLNVAVTRARRHLTLVCDSDTVSRHEFISGLIEHMSKFGLVKSGHEYQDVIAYAPCGPSVTDKNSTKADCTTSSKKTREEPKKAKTNKKIDEKEKEKETEERRREYETKVKEFLKSPKLKIEFPPNLNSFERLLVHDIAEKYKLVHESQGEGKDRHIILYKNKTESGPQPEEIIPPSTEDNIPSGHEASLFHTLKEVDFEEEEGCKIEQETTNKKSKRRKNKKALKNEENIETHHDPEMEYCSFCGKDVLRQNFTLHSLQCERRQKDLKLKQEINKNLRTDSSVKKKKGRKNNNSGTEKEDFDDIIEQFQKENNSCSFPRCKNPTVVLFQQCPFCRHMFCLNHHQAEVHGCTEEARKHARTVLIKSVSKHGVLTPGSGIPSKKPNEVRKAMLHRKLDKKLAEMSNDRKGKQGSKDKS